MNRKRIEELLAFHRNGLLNDTLPFWLKHAIDRKCGGYFNYIDHDGTVCDTDKAVWIQGRFAWLLAMLYNEVEPRKEWLDASLHGIRFLEKHCFDTDGRMFFRVTRDGRPLRKRRYVFSETFGTIAFAEYGLAAKDQARMAFAKRLYQLLVRHYQNPDLLPPKVFPQTRSMKGLAMPMIMTITSQQMRRLGEDALYDDVIDFSIREITDHHMHPDEKAVLENVGPKGERVDCVEGRCVNPGHAIEAAWFILEEARRNGDKSLIEKACTIIDWSLALGWDRKYGGLLYFVDVEGKPPEQYEHDMKLWWPHNEALYATLLAHHMTGRKKYETWYERLHDWAYSHFPDRKHGEWFKYLRRDGAVSSTLKGNRWAGPFHLPRSQFLMWKLCERMLNG